jgi:hypothetical protein
LRWRRGMLANKNGLGGRDTVRRDDQATKSSAKLSVREAR